MIRPTRFRFLTTAFQKGKPLSHYPPEQFPVRGIPESLKRYLYGTDPHGHKPLLPDRYEFLVYRLLRDRLEAGDIFCRDSIRYCSFEDDLLDDQQWQAKDRLLAETGLPILMQPIQEHLADLEQQLEDRLAVVNHVPINAQIIGANEHESHYVFDILFNNTTDIQPDIHSTDTHGTNEVNFALLHVFGYQFAPRYRDLQEKVQHVLYGFKHPSQYGAVLLKPIRKINTRLIVDEWEQMQRILVSLALKTTTQSIIVGKLSAYARKNKTRRALWEYDSILRSLYLLEYIDSPPLRRNVQRALNRGKNYHQLRRAVSYANFGKLRFKTEYEQQLWEEYSRLRTNGIIYYNATILSQLVAYKEHQGDQQSAAMMAPTNLLLIMSDEHNPKMLGCAGSRPNGAPSVLFVSFVSPHYPLVVPEEYFSL